MEILTLKCENCGRQLPFERGKSVKCPSCRTVNLIRGEGTASDESNTPPPPSESENNSTLNQSLVGKYCAVCGNPLVHTAVLYTKCGTPVDGAIAADPNAVPKSRGLYILLGLLFGWLGIHNFYAGRNGVGIAQVLILIFTLGMGIYILIPWALIEVIAVHKDGKGVLMA